MARVIANRLTVSLSLAAGVAFALAVTAPGARAQTIQNGSFSSFTDGGEDRLTNSSASPWTTGSSYSFIISETEARSTGFGSGNSLQLWSQGDNGGLNGRVVASPDGGNFLAADSMYLNPSFILQQTITGLTVNANYNITFWQAAGQQTGWTGDTTDTWTVKLGSQTKVAPTMSNPSKNFTNWQQVSLSFVADATSMVLQFLLSGTSPGGNQQPPFALLDGIAISQTTTTVPEPATAAMLLAGVAGLVGFGRRRVGAS